MPTLLRRIRSAQPALLQAGIALLALAVVCLPGLWLDARTFNGIDVWIKPIKFQVSVGVFLLTIGAYFLALPPGDDRSRAGRFVVVTGIASGGFEVLYITLQAARGQASHYNFGNAFTIAMYGLMGVGAVLLTSTALVQAWMIRRRGLPTLSPALRDGLVIGLTLTFVLGAGFGGYMSSADRHWVGGVYSDAGGLPLFEWSRTGGDLRVAHFFGIHAMHFVPAFAWFAASWLPERAARLAVYGFAVLLAAFTTAVFAQAVLGRPFGV